MGDVTIRQIWGIAKSKELSMSDDELYLLVYRETGKDTISGLTKQERGAVMSALIRLKHPESSNGAWERYRRGTEHGSSETARQRKKIYVLAEWMWGDLMEGKLRGMSKRMFKIENVAWLTRQQCSELIEALKAMQERMEAHGKKDDTETKEGEGTGQKGTAGEGHPAAGQAEA